MSVMREKSRTNRNVLTYKKMEIPTVDVQDLSYQISPKTPPAYEGEWKFPREQDGWMHAHNSFRNELKLVADALAICAEKGLSSSRVVAVNSMWDAHLLWVHEHHHTESDLLDPGFEQGSMCQIKFLVHTLTSKH
mmetsp:Transcript_31007/g.81090  ORF Transcript_31007/g.81090 Transcript_31007/m.81090 type:complete len:135 (+) Transcript_31007:383-787(+)